MLIEHCLPKAYRFRLPSGTSRVRRGRQSLELSLQPMRNVVQRLSAIRSVVTQTFLSMLLNVQYVDSCNLSKYKRFLFHLIVLLKHNFNVK